MEEEFDEPSRNVKPRQQNEILPNSALNARKHLHAPTFD